MKLLFSCETPCVALVLLLTAAGCSRNSSSASDQRTARQNESFVRTACGTCHAFTPADRLDKEAWSEVIPFMACRMGIYSHNGQAYESERGDSNLPPEVYPSTPVITHDQLDKIFHYYRSLAPDQLPEQERDRAIGKTTTRFKIATKDRGFRAVEKVPITTFVDFIEGQNQVLVGSMTETGDLASYNLKGDLLWHESFPSAPTYVDRSNNQEWLVTCIGSVMPSNAKTGSIHTFDPESNESAPVWKDLRRPVQSMRIPDSPHLLVNGFGHLVGRTFIGDPQNASEVQILADTPGALSSVFVDWDGDGLQDIVTLFAQGRESIALFRNTGSKFQLESLLLEFLPVDGSTSFELIDINKDGRLDIVYTCGDNADKSVVLKPYHGVRIYLNQGDNRFDEAFFYPIHGCYESVTRDFDLDGDFDIVTISFFSDYEGQPEEALVYFENTGQLQFRPYRIDGFDRGRWLTLEADDADGDGDEDLLIGNFSMGPESFMSREQVIEFRRGPACLYLENTTR